MSIFDFFRKKRGPKRPKNEDPIQEEEDNKGLERSIRRKRAEIYKRRLEQLNDKLEEIRMEQEIRDAEAALAEFDDEDDDDQTDPEDLLAGSMNPDVMLMELITKALNRKEAPKTVINQAQGPPPTTKISYSDEQIRGLKAQIPAFYLKQIRKKPDDEVIDGLMQKFPDADDDTIKRAVIILKEA